MVDGAGIRSPAWGVNAVVRRMKDVPEEAPDFRAAEGYASVRSNRVSA
jgi:hypothetical protein